jgi:hypothetical protein
MIFPHNLENNSYYQTSTEENGMTNDSYKSFMSSTSSNSALKIEHTKKIDCKANESEFNNLLPKSLMNDINNLCLEDESTMEEIEGREDKKFGKIQHKEQQHHFIVFIF